MDQIVELQDTHQSFYEFISFNWHGDPLWKAYLKEQKNVKEEKTAEYEEMKAEFYKKNLDPQFETHYLPKEGSHRAEFIEFCKTQGTIKSLVSRNFTKKWAIKNQLYFAFLLMTPINLKVGFIIYLLAVMVNLSELLQRGEYTLIQCFLLEEDSTTIVDLIFIAFSGLVYRTLFIVCLVIWACLNVAEFICHVTNRKNKTYVDFLKPLRPAAMYMKIHRIWFVQLKSYIEVFIAVTSPFSWILFSGCAPLVPILYTQTIRLKYATSVFTRQTFESIQTNSNKFLPQAIFSLLAKIVSPIMERYIQIEQKKKDAVNTQSEEKVSKKSSKEDKKPKVDEPKIYEVSANDLD